MDYTLFKEAGVHWRGRPTKGCTKRFQEAGGLQTSAWKIDQEASRQRGRDDRWHTDKETQELRHTDGNQWTARRLAWREQGMLTGKSGLNLAWSPETKPSSRSMDSEAEAFYLLRWERGRGSFF